MVSVARACSVGRSTTLRKCTMCAVLSVAVVSAPRLAFSDTARGVQLPEWAQPGRSGTNALYAFLQLLGTPVSYQQLASELPCDPKRGSSLADLAEAAERHGVRAKALHVAPQDLTTLETPFILHLDLLDYGGSGHFVTVMRIDDPQKDGNLLVRYIDGGGAGNSQMRLRDMLSTVSGFVLSDERSRRDRRSLALFVVVAAVLSLPICVAVFRHASRSGR